VALGLPEPTGLFLLAIPAFLGAALVLLVFLRPDPLQVAKAAALANDTALDSARHAPAAASLAAGLGDRQLRTALLVLALTNLTMVGVMAVAPVHLHDHGAGMGMVGLMVSAHIAAMYLPSPISGWLSDTLGARVVAGMGALLLLAAGTVAAVAGAGRAGIVGALLLLGVGWNAGLIGGSALLRDAPVSPSLRTRAEGLGELGMGAAAAAGGSGAGLLLATGGFGLLGLVAAAPCLLILAAIPTAGGAARAGDRADRQPALMPPPRAELASMRRQNEATHDHALQPARADRPAGVGAVPGGDDLRRPPRRLGRQQAGGRPHCRPVRRGGRQLHRYRQLLCGW
jgi:hypothetical protein